jgi:hypothetical protein
MRSKEEIQCVALVALAIWDVCREVDELCEVVTNAEVECCMSRNISGS